MAKHDRKDNKAELPIARVTTLIKGMTKRKFFEEMKRRNQTEANLAREIITKHYL